MKTRLRTDKLLETAKKIGARIDERFPNAGLSKVAAEIVEATSESLTRAEAIGRPNIWLRAGLVLLVVIAVGGIAIYFQAGEGPKPPWKAALEFLDAAKGSAAVLVAAAVFLFTLETRLKRHRALRAVHELRALAHIIDMHQLAKDPTQLGHQTQPLEVAGKPMDAEAMRLYLHYCTELLAVVGKLGQLYV